ncbi:hypothetical protein Tco_0246543 [Tanacetum coccineum]
MLSIKGINGLRDKLVHLKMMWFLMVHLEELEMKRVDERREWVRKEAVVEFMVELFEEDKDGKKNENDRLYQIEKANDQIRKA